MYKSKHSKSEPLDDYVVVDVVGFDIAEIVVEISVVEIAVGGLDEIDIGDDVEISVVEIVVEIGVGGVVEIGFVDVGVGFRVTETSAP